MTDPLTALEGMMRNFTHVVIFHKEFGTLIQWGSLRFSKAVKCLLEICQKTISYNNVSENSHKYVRIVSENYQKQISVKTVSEKIWKYVRKVSDFINVSENCQCQFSLV